MSFNQTTQTLEELYIMELFRIEYSDFPKGKLSKSESPDFILWETPKTAVGIELTKLHGITVRKEKTHFPLKIKGYQPPEFNRENIEYTINAKNDKLYIYRQNKLSQLWLIITADFEESPVTYNFSNKLENWSFHSGFQKIFLFELKSRKVFELNVLA